MTRTILLLRTMTKRFLAAFLAVVLTAPSATAGGTVPTGTDWLPSGAGDWRSGCNHYQNRARFLPREGEIEFVVLLADACTAAERSLRATNEHERWAAEWFLAKVLELRDTIVDLNLRRVYGDTGDPLAKPKRGDGQNRVSRTVEIARVGKWGEYLIAHRMGLFSAYDVWLDSGTDFSIAFHR